jgi:XTP/dITP diphosphohydrolase
LKKKPFQELVIATHNPGKLAEFKALLSPYVTSIVSAKDLGLPEPEETGTTFAENALLKAQKAAQRSGRAALADDSGLCVSALKGAPGLFSARWAGSDKNFSLAMERIHHSIGNNPDRRAHFICVLALIVPDQKPHLFEGRIDGTIAWPPRGSEGHGYDPIFMPKGYNKTFAEIDADEKNSISHRGLALKKLLKHFAK